MLCKMGIFVILDLMCKFYDFHKAFLMVIFLQKCDEHDEKLYKSVIK